MQRIIRVGVIMGAIARWGGTLCAITLLGFGVSKIPKRATTFTPVESPDEPTDEPWKVINVHDGDTIRVQRDGQIKKIRFACIDAPELAQPGGVQSRDNLRSLIDGAGGKVKLRLVSTDRYGRSVAEVWVGNQLAQSVQTVSGNAYSYAKYKADCPNWDAVTHAEGYAIKNRLGVWADPKTVKPWDWQKSRRDSK